MFDWRPAESSFLLAQSKLTVLNFSDGDALEPTPGAQHSARRRRRPFPVLDPNFVSTKGIALPDIAEGAFLDHGMFPVLPA
jgi:hypothetical protein